LKETYLKAAPTFVYFVCFRKEAKRIAPFDLHTVSKKVPVVFIEKHDERQ